jgi:hypothetical protein
MLLEVVEEPPTQVLTVVPAVMVAAEVVKVRHMLNSLGDFQILVEVVVVGALAQDLDRVPLVVPVLSSLHTLPKYLKTHNVIHKGRI